MLSMRAFTQIALGYLQADTNLESAKGDIALCVIYWTTRKQFSLKDE